jgi:hypothetical protein
MDLERFRKGRAPMALSASGSVPLALPGGEAKVDKPVAAPASPLLLRTPAKSEIAFAGQKKKTPAFWKETKRAFGAKK